MFARSLSHRRNVRSRSGQPDALQAACRCACEPLERRVLLSHDRIDWINEGSGPGDDTDSFNAVYGANAATARAIVRRAIHDWERVITNFNGSGGRNTYTLNVSAAAITGRGVTSGIGYDALNKPQSATITMDDDAGAGWYFDPVIGSATVPDDGEFVNPLTPFMSSFTGAGAAADDDDFYRTIVHEIGHAMGLSSTAPRITGVEVDVGDDPNSANPADRLRTVTTGGITYTLTTAGGRHLFEGGGAYAGPVHPNELMNDGRTVGAPPTTRQLIGDTIATFLRDLYSYTVTLPSFINTFYANLNTTTNVLTINGDINPSGSLNDVIDLEVTGASMSFEANGTDEVIPGAEFSTIVVNAGNGNDDVDVDGLLSGKTVTINLGGGNDRLDVAQEFDDIDTNLGSNLTANGGAGTDTIHFHDTADGAGGDDYTLTSTTFTKNASVINRIITYGTFEALVIDGSAQPSVYNINSTASATPVTVNGGAGNDEFNVGNGDIDSNLDNNVTVNGNGGTDALYFDDTADGAGGDDYTLTSTTLTKNAAFINRIVTYGTVESLTIFGSQQPSTYTITSTAAGTPVTIYAGDAAAAAPEGAADDIFEIGGGDFDTNIDANITVFGGGGIDRVVIDDTADTLNDTYEINALSFTKSSTAISVNWENVFPPSVPDIEEFVLNASDANNTINLNGLGGVFFPPFPDPPQNFPVNATLNGGGGNDNIVIAASGNVLSALRGDVHVEGQAGSDHLRVSDFADAGADTFTLTSTTLTNSDWGSTLTFGTLESMLLDANNAANTINVTSTFDGEISINGNGGADTISVEGNFLGRYITVDGGTGFDTINVNTDAAGWAGVRFTSNQDLASLHVFDEGNVLVSSPGDMVVTTQSLTIDGTGKLDLTDEDMIVDYAAASPIDTLESYLTSGYNAGAWNGSGINSSTAAAAGNTGIGYAESSEVFSVFPAVFSGMAVDDTAVLLKYTFYGDTDLNGNVNLSDFNRLAANFGASPDERWFDGNFDFNGNVNLSDFNRLAANFGSSGLSPDGQAPVPSTAKPEDDDLRALLA